MLTVRAVESVRDWIQDHWENVPLWKRLLGAPLLLVFIVVSLLVLIPIAPFVDV